MKEVSSKNKKIIIITISISIILLIYYGLIIFNYIEKSAIHTEPGITLNMEPDIIDYKEYDVDGMSEEEINKYLKTIKDMEKSTNE